MNKILCEYCGAETSKEDIRIEKKYIGEDWLPCYCKVLKLISSQKKKIKKLKEEIGYLNQCLMDASEADWDQEGLYEDALNGTWNGNDLGGEPDIKYAKWLKKRYGIITDREGNVL